MLQCAVHLLHIICIWFLFVVAAIEPRVADKFAFIDYLRFTNSVRALQGSSIAYSSDGEMIAVGRQLKSAATTKNKKSQNSFVIEIWRVADRSLIASWDSVTKANLTFSPDNSLIAAGGYGGKVYVWGISNGELLHSLDFETNANSSGINFLMFTQNGQNIVVSTSGFSSKINVWNLANGTNHIRFVPGEEFVSMALSSDGQTLAVGRKNEIVDLYRFDDLTWIEQLKVAHIPSSLKFSPNGQNIAYVSNLPLPSSNTNRSGYNIYLYDIKDGRLLKVFYDKAIFFQTKQSIQKFAISPDGQYLAASYVRSVPSDFFIGAPKATNAGYYGRIRVWCIEDGKQLPTFRGHKYRTYGLVFSPDSKFLASVGGDIKVRWWRIPPRNYLWLWLLGIAGLTAFAGWQRMNLIH